MLDPEAGVPLFLAMRFCKWGMARVYDLIMDELTVQGGGGEHEPASAPWVRTGCQESLWRESICPGLRTDVPLEAEVVGV